MKKKADSPKVKTQILTFLLRYLCYTKGSEDQRKEDNMVERKIIYQGGTWKCKEESGVVTEIDPKIKTEINMFGTWMECQIVIRGNALLVDEEAQITPDMLDDFEMMIRQYKE